jgi:hypothetical protein
MNPNSEADQFRPAEVIPVLEAIPGILRSLFESLPGAWLDFREDADAWSPRTVLVHFIHNERTNWIPRARVILSSTPTRQFSPFQQLPPQGEIEDADIAAMLSQFAELRQENLTTLRGFNLKPDDYERTGEHPVLGTVKLGQLLATWVVHDLNHLHQVLKTLAKFHASAVGPWRKNLAIIDL